jgi:hypothetical protein
VRFKNTSDEQRKLLQEWLSTHLPETDEDDPVNCRLTDLSLGGCYLSTNSPFPRGTRVILSIKIADVEMHAGGVVLVTHPEAGMGVQFLQSTNEQRDQVHAMITALRKNGDKSPELQVEADGLETQSPADNLGKFQVFASQVSAGEVTDITGGSTTGDSLVDLFRERYQLPVEVFIQQMREQRESEIAQSR